MVADEEDEERVVDVSTNDKVFQRMFYSACAITVHKRQGSTFHHKYSIHEFEKFGEKLKCVALSRATAIEHINIC